MQIHYSFKSTFFRYNKITNGTTHICTYQAITQQLHMLQPYFKQEMTQQTLLYLHLLEVHASSSSVISQPIQKLFNCTTYNGGKKLGRNVKPYVPLHLIHNKHAHMHAHTQLLDLDINYKQQHHYYACHILDSRLTHTFAPLKHKKSHQITLEDVIIQLE